jgi:hypothetical protein
MHVWGCAGGHIGRRGVMGRLFGHGGIERQAVVIKFPGQSEGRRVRADQLRAIPADERNLLLLASHAINQITVLRKVLIFSLNYESDSEIENTLSAGQSQTILRFLFGALAEAGKW